MVAHLIERDGYGVTLASRLRLPNTLSTLDWPVGPDGHHSQWKDAAPSSFLSGLSGIVPWRDVFSNQILNSTLFVHGTYDARFAFGLTHVNRRRESALLVELKNERYEENPDVFPVNLISSLQGVLNPPKSSKRIPKDQRVHHFNADGTFEVVDRPPIEILFERRDDQKSNYFAQTYLTSAPQDPSWLSGFPLMVYAPYPFDLSNAALAVRTAGIDAFGPLLERLVDLRDNPGNASDVWDPGPYRAESTLQSFDFTIKGGSVSIEYTYRGFLGYRTYPFREWDSVWKIRIDLSLVETGDLSPDPLHPFQAPVAYYPHVDYSFELISGSFTEKDGDETVSTVMTPYRRVFDMDWYNNGVSIDLRVLTTPLISSLGDIRSQAMKIIYDHGHHWHDRIYQLMCSVVFAFHNAVSSKMQFLKQNYLEVLAELSALLELLPDVAPLVEAMKLFSRGDLRALTRLGDFLAGNLLKYSFGIRPTIEVINELNRLGPKLGSWYDMEGRPGKGTFYGKFRFPYNNAESPRYKGAVLTTHCAADITFSEHALFQALVTLYGYGVLPSFKSLWEVKSLSFVWDWFTNMSSRFEAIDLSLISFMLRVDAVSFSHRVVTPGEGVLTEHPFEKDRFKLIYYYRGVTRAVPHLVDGGIDYLRVQRSPNIGIFASLLYVLTKGRFSK